MFRGNQVVWQEAGPLIFRCLAECGSCATQFLGLVFVLVIGANDLPAAPPVVGVIVGDNAAPLERLAAGHLQSVIERVCRAEVKVQAEPTPEVALNVFLGTSESNVAVAKAMSNVPAVGEQTISIKRNGDDLVVFGGSPPAVFWAVHELAFRMGVRQLLTGDVYPEKTVPIEQFGAESVLLNPIHSSRAWTLMDDRVDGAESLTFVEKQGLLRQLGKLKFNRLVLSVSPWQPFVQYRWQGVSKRTAMLARGQRYPIDRDAPGRTVFGESTEFRNSDFAQVTTSNEMMQVGVEHLRKTIAEGRRLGMSATLSFPLWEAPLEFAEKLPSQSGRWAAWPTDAVSFEDLDWLDFTKTRVRAYLKTYPTIDTICFQLPTQEMGDASSAWGWLSDQGGADLRERLLPSDGSASHRAKLNAQILSLAFLYQLLQQDSVFDRPDGTSVAVAVQGVDPQLLQWIDRLLSQKGSGHVSVYPVTAAGSLAKSEQTFVDGVVSTQLLLTLADPVVGVFPQSGVRRVGRSIVALQDHGWQGYIVEASSLAEIEPSVQFLSRVSWDANWTVRQSHDDLFGAITGKSSVADRLWLGFGHLETATDLLLKHPPAFARIDETELPQLGQSDDASDWAALVTDAYTQAMVEMYRSNGNSRSIARPQIFYWAKRGEYVLALIESIKATQLATEARAEGQQELAIEQMEIAIEQLYNAIDSFGDVARNSSDRGTIARLNVHAYQPLVDAYEALLEEN